MTHNTKQHSIKIIFLSFRRYVAEIDGVIHNESTLAYNRTLCKIKAEEIVKNYKK